MKIIKLFLLFTFALWADFRLDVPNNINVPLLQENNKKFYKEVSKVFVQPLYRPINTARFENMRADEMSKEMQQSIKDFLPLYFKTENPFFIEKQKYFLDSAEKKRYPEIAIKRMIKVLNKYMALLRIEKRDDEANKILNKLLEDTSKFMENAQTITDFLSATTYYTKIIRTKLCNSNKMKEILIVNKPKNETYFFDVLEKNNQLYLKDEKNHLQQLSNENANMNEEFVKQVMEYYIYLFKKNDRKLRIVLEDGSYEAMQKYKKYIDDESSFDIANFLKLYLSKKIVQIRNLLSLENNYFGNIPEYYVHEHTYFIFKNRDIGYESYKYLTHKYDTLLNSCP